MEEVGSDLSAREALAGNMGQPRPVPPVVRARPALEAEAFVARAIWTATSRHPLSTGRLVEAGVMIIHISVCICGSIHNNIKIRIPYFQLWNLYQYSYSF